MNKLSIKQVLSVGILCISCISSVLAAPTASDYAQLPKALADSAPPLVMLALSNDHSLYYKAFTDYHDYDGVEGLQIPKETTYDNDREYFGYFDSNLCYTYAVSVFEPVDEANNHLCASAEWSGNFLNWATMTRMDVLRKVLFGGFRSTEAAAFTVLERSHLPSDAHSFAKVYLPSDATIFKGVVDTSLGLSANEGITICNTTLHDFNEYSQETNNPPLMRVVKGNYSLWASGPRYQCLFKGDGKPDFGGGSKLVKAWGDFPAGTTKQVDQKKDKNGNPIEKKGFGYLDVPKRSEKVSDLIVRVKTCEKNKSTVLQGECGQYESDAGSTYLRPEGILQANMDTVHWGLLTGTYNKNKSGGVLRKNTDSIEDEINQQDGTFVGEDGIIATINKLRIVDWYFGDKKQQAYISSCKQQTPLNFDAGNPAKNGN